MIKKKLPVMILSASTALCLILSGCADNASATAQTAASSSAASISETADGSSETSADYTATSSLFPESDIETVFSDRDLDASYDASKAVTITLSDAGSTADSSAVSIDGSIITISEEGTYILTGSLSNGRIVVSAPDDAKVQLVLSDASISSSDGSAIYFENADKGFLTIAENTENTISDAASYSDSQTYDAAVFSTCDLTVNGTGQLSVTGNYKHGIFSKDTLTLSSVNLTVTAVSQCLGAHDTLQIADGSYNLFSQGDAIKASNNEDLTQNNIYIEGGSFTIDAGEDALHADGSIYITGGTYSLSAAGDGIDAGLDVRIEGGDITVTDSTEGIEGKRITIAGGTVSITASDDGINASGETETDASAVLTIDDGTIWVNAQGDGLDSNGYLYINGGTITIDGPTNGGNGSLDYGIDALITGGTLLAAGSGEMVEMFSDTSTQASFAYQLQTSHNGDTITISKDGEVLASYTPNSSYQAVIFSDASLSVGDTVTITAGSETVEITLDSVVYSNTSFGMGQMGSSDMGRPGEVPMNQQDPQQMPGAHMQ